jgi:hemerythrin
MMIDRGLIDDDHRHLIDIINRFGARLSRGTAGIPEAVDVLHALEFYAATHFEREEWLQRLASYPECQSHHDDHQRLMRRLDEIIARTRSVTEADRAEVVPQLSRLLRSWLLDHIIKLDLRMKPYVHLMKRHAAELPHLKTVAADSTTSTPAP